MADTILPQASLFLGIIPALILMYISLKGYEGQYKEKNVFLSFVIGLIAGFITALLETYTIAVGVLFIVLFPIVEQLFKTILLNIGRLHEKRQTVIYGLSLGLGFGAIFTQFSLITIILQSGNNMLTLTLTIIGSIGIILIHGATGAYIGYGIYAGKLTRYVLIAILLLVPVSGFIFLTTLIEREYLQIGLVAYGLIVYWYITTKVMSRILVDSNRRKRTKKNTSKA
jgi:hypothetical protein